MTRPDGTPVNAVYGFTNMLIKLIQDTDADHIAVIFDAARKTFRNDIYPEYKAQRPPPPEELIPQFELVREATRAMNVACIEMDGFEADDLIASYAKAAKEAGAEVTIVSSDKDLMQLVDDHVTMFDAMKNREIGADQVVEKFGVGPDKVIHVQALAGDSTDNVPGVPGIGVKTAAQLIEEYGDLEGVLSHAEEIKQPKRRQSLIEHAEDARVSMKLVTLRDDVPLPMAMADLLVKPPEPDALLGFLKDQAFKSLLARVESQLAQSGDKVLPGSRPGEIAGGAKKSPAPKPAEEREAGYELVQEKEALERWVAAATEQGWVAIDTETTSLDAMRAELVGVSLALGKGEACYIPLAHVAPADQESLDLGDWEKSPNEKTNGKLKQIPRDAAVKLLKPMLADPSVLKIGHNIKYDMEVLARYGLEVHPVDDTMILSYVLDGSTHGHGMDELADLHFGHTTIKFSDVTGTGKAQITFDKVPLDKALDYAAEDADVTYQLHALLKPRLAHEHLVSVYETLDRPLIDVLTAMERAGIKIDAKVLKDLSADFARRIADLEGEIHKLAGHEFNIGSPKQLGEILFDEMGLPGAKKTKTGAYGTGADVLETLAAEGHDLPGKVLDWRQLAKLKSTYTDTLIDQINPDTGRVHTNYGQAIASTGRLSSNDPNLQNIPIRTEEGRKIRAAFVADRGCVLLSADYSQIELRLLAHVAGIDALKQAFHEGQDIHAITASQVFGIPVEGMDPMVRRQAKAINFGIIYGISAFGLARNLRIPRADAKHYIDAYFERYPGIADYMEQAKADAKRQGYVTTLYGRRCYTPQINDRNPAARNFAERAAINAPIQGGAADIIKRAMLRLPGALAAAKLNAKMLLQVHDELVFEVPKSEIDATEELVKEIMEDVAHLEVPLVVDTGTGANWEQAH